MGFSPLAFAARALAMATSISARRAMFEIQTKVPTFS
jgi:hypothetical protein